jgi:proteic killer suppression protein
MAYTMIRSFRSKALAELWSSGRSGKIDARLWKRILVRLDRLDASIRPEDMNLPGFDLKGFHPVRYTVHVNGPWGITFEFADGEAYRVHLEQYH